MGGGGVGRGPNVPKSRQHGSGSDPRPLWKMRGRMADGWVEGGGERGAPCRPEPYITALTLYKLVRRKMDGRVSAALWRKTSFVKQTDE